jgi:hypothetical protein
MLFSLFLLLLIPETCFEVHDQESKPNADLLRYQPYQESRS